MKVLRLKQILYANETIVKYHHDSQLTYNEYLFLNQVWLNIIFKSMIVLWTTCIIEMKVMPNLKKSMDRKIL